jgi:hypothetical protein
MLRAGQALDIAGYTLAPELALAIDGIDAAHLAPAGCPAHWFELAATAGRPLSPAANRIVAGWRERGANVHVELVCGQPFWTTQEIAECPQLVDASVAACREAAHA